MRRNMYICMYSNPYTTYLQEMKITLIGASLLRELRHMPGVEVMYSPGATIQHVSKLVEGKVYPWIHDTVGLFVGTNNVGNGQYNHEIIQATEVLIQTLRPNYPNIKQIIVFGLIPRQIDHNNTKTKITLLNWALKKLCKINNTTFQNSYNQFIHKGEVNDQFYRYTLDILGADGMESI